MGRIHFSFFVGVFDACPVWSLLLLPFETHAVANMTSLMATDGYTSYHSRESFSFTGVASNGGGMSPSGGRGPSPSTSAIATTKKRVGPTQSLRFDLEPKSKSSSSPSASVQGSTFHLPQFDRYIQGTSKRPFPNLVNFVPAVAYHLCLNLPEAFSQPENGLLEVPCTEVVKST